MSVVCDSVNVGGAGVNSLSEEQKNFLEECENEFANRYTELDRDYMRVGFSL